MQQGPSREDIIFGRAVLAFRLVSREQLDACLAEQRQHQGAGHPRTLAQVMVGRQLISVDQYRRIVYEIQRRQQQQPTPHIPVAAPQQGGAPMPGGAPGQVLPPDITASGRYRFGQQMPRPPSPPPVAAADNTDIDAAVTSWERVSSEGDWEVVDDPADAAVPSPQQQKRQDEGIRKLLGIPDDQEQFDFGPYRVLAFIAAGGMGVIYRVEESTTRAHYALKALLNVEANEKQLRRFFQEARSAEKLDHPGIVKIHDIGVVEGIPYFTMDFLEGTDLHHILRGRKLPLDENLKVLAAVCRAVHYAHENGVIHRDLKPANIVVLQGNRPVLTDFGLAKNVDSQFKLTAEGAMVGTPLYLSPEQVSGRAHEVDGRCDVYGLGVMLYQMLTGKLPYIGRNPYEVYRKVMEEDPTPPSQINSAVTPGMEKICTKALALLREERYESAEVMADDIERVLRGEPVEVELPTPRAKLKKKRKKGKGVAAAGSNVVLIGIIVGAFLLVVVLGLLLLAFLN